VKKYPQYLVSQWQEAGQGSYLHMSAFSRVNIQSDVYLPYAYWLLESDRFNEAQEGINAVAM
jgi:hypothetical protein